MSLRDIYSKLNHQTEQSQHQFKLYGLITFFGYSGFYFYNQYFNISPLYENLTLRLSASLLALGLAIHNFWPQRIKFILPFYWYFTLLFNLPIFFVFMLLMNDGAVTWQLNVLSAFVLLVIFTDWKSSIIIGLLGTTLGYLLFKMHHGQSVFIENFVGLVTSYCVIIIYLGAFLHKKSKVMNEKVNSLKYQSGAMAHEMRTPLANVLISSTILQNVAGRLSTARTLDAPQRDRVLLEEIKEIQDVAQDLARITKGSQNLINLLLANLKQDFAGLHHTPLSMAETLRHALGEFAFKTTELDKVHVDIQHDFQFKGNTELMTHIFFNLLKNSLYFIHAVGQGEIYITVTVDRNHNVVLFKDTGPGIPHSHLPHIFKPFYSKRPHGTGIGLSFCRKAIETMNGRITVTSEPNVHTTFRLQLPKL